MKFSDIYKYIGGIGASAVLAVAVSACSFYSNFNRTEQLGSIVEQSDSVMEAQSPMAAMSWRTLFPDSLLAGWVNEALANNTSLQQARINVEKAKASLTASRLALLPSINLSADGSVSRTASDRFQIAPSASWELDIFGKQRNLRKGAEQQLAADEAWQQAVQSDLIASVVDGYYTLLLLDEQLAISERTLKTWDENIRALQAFKRAGRANEAAVLQARANRLKVEASVLALRKSISEQENVIRSVLFKSDALLPRSKFSDMQMPDTLSAGIPLAVLANRPDVRKAEALLARGFYNINVARAAFYPSVKLSGSAGWETSSGPVGNVSQWIASALGSAMMPLFSKGTNRANLKIAEAEFESLKLSYGQTLLDAGLEVNNALMAWQTARKKINVDKKQIVALQGAVHNTQLLMRNTNATNYLEVLTAQQRLLDAELSEATDRYDAIKAVISLYHALGGGASM